MRKALVSTGITALTIVSMLGSSSRLLAAERQDGESVAVHWQDGDVQDDYDYTTGTHSDCQDGRSRGGRNGCNSRRNRRNIDGLDPAFNCGCNGSYKFPVPPLYTYHWPGMFSHQLMTDYHSPWRFPPIAVYSDEPELGGRAERTTDPVFVVEPATAMGPVDEPAVTTRPRISMSQRMRQMNR